MPTNTTTASADENRRKAQEALSHLDALAADPHFAWFMNTVIKKACDDEREKALSVSQPPEKAEQARWRHDLARELCGKPDALRTIHERTLEIGKS